MFDFFGCFFVLFFFWQGGPCGLIKKATPFSFTRTHTLSLSLSLLLQVSPSLTHDTHDTLHTHHNTKLRALLPRRRLWALAQPAAPAQPPAQHRRRLVVPRTSHHPRLSASVSEQKEREEACAGAGAGCCGEAAATSFDPALKHSLFSRTNTPTKKRRGWDWEFVSFSLYFLARSRGTRGG